MKTTLTILFIILIISCTPYKYLEKHKDEICAKCIEENTVQKTKDSIIVKTDTLWIDVSENIIDSTYVELYFECDSNNDVLMTRVKKIKDSDKVISKYTFQNSILTIQNKSYQDSIQELRTIIKHIRDNVRVVEKTINKEVVPKWVYLTGIVVFLFLITLLIIILKK